MIWDEFLRHFRFCDEEDSGHACLLAKPYTGYLLYSFHVKPDTYEVGVIYVHSPELRKLGIKELHLVKAIKIKK